MENKLILQALKGRVLSLQMSYWFWRFITSVCIVLIFGIPWIGIPFTIAAAIYSDGIRKEVNYAKAELAIFESQLTEDKSSV